MVGFKNHDVVYLTGFHHPILNSSEIEKICLEFFLIFLHKKRGLSASLFTLVRSTKRCKSELFIFRKTLFRICCAYRGSRLNACFLFLRQLQFQRSRFHGNVHPHHNVGELLCAELAFQIGNQKAETQARLRMITAVIWSLILTLLFLC